MPGRIRFTAAGIGFFLVMFLLVNCKKEYSYEGGTAEFSIFETGGSCANPVISGDYETGKALGSSNTVQLLVQVTKTGKYSFQTNTAAGILFTSAGEFSDTGIHTILLSGTGIPASAGNVSFTPVLTSACSFTITIVQKQVETADYSLAGAPGQCSSPQVTGNYMQGTPMTIGNTVIIQVNVISPGDYNIQTDMQDGISFAASGHFTQPGLQAVTLLASGTPDIPRSLSFTPVGNGSGCSFNIDVEATGSPATYVLESGGNYCVGTVAGDFTAGTALTVANTYTLRVYVQLPGNYSISTSTINGIAFYSSGIFTDLGVQFVTITGHGTPAASGKFTFTPGIVGPHPLGGEVCDFDLTVN